MEIQMSEFVFTEDDEHEFDALIEEAEIRAITNGIIKLAEKHRFKDKLFTACACVLYALVYEYNIPERERVKLAEMVHRDILQAPIRENNEKLL